MSTEHEDFVHLTVQAKDGLSAPVTEVVRYDQFVRQLFKADTEAMMALHCALGVAGEVGEIVEAETDKNNLEEELGDLEFYLQATRLHYGISRAQVLNVPLPESAVLISMQRTAPACMVVAAGNLCDVIKREYVYRKGRDLVALLSTLRVLDSTLEEHYTYFNFTRSEILQANADKLCKRYVELRYTDQAAIARADKSSSPSQEKD
jgi:hypothetical protein